MSRPFGHGGIPARWRATRLREFVARRRDVGRPDLPLLSVNLPEGVVKRVEGDGRPAPSEDLSGYQVVHSGDLVMNQLGKPHGALGVSPHEGIISPAYFVAKIGPTAHPRFVHHLLRTRLYISEYERRGKFMPPNQFDISWDQFRDIEIVLPPLPDQRAIADFLDRETARIDALITANRRMIEVVEERFRIRGHHLTTGGSPSDGWTPGPHWLGPVPRAWQPRKVAWSLRTGSGTTPPSDRTGYYSDDGVPWVTTAELRETVILQTAKCVTESALRDHSALKVFPPGTILVAMYGATVGRVGVLGVSAAMNQACCAIFGHGDLSPRFVYWWLRLHREDLLEMAYGAGQPNISQETIRSLRVPAPSLVDQEALVRSLDEEADKLRLLNSTLVHQTNLLVEHRQALITAAVTGELDVGAAA